MHPPAADEHHARLARFAGIWHGRERMHPSQWLPEGGECTAISSFRVDLGGLAVIADYRQLDGEQVTYSGHGVYTIDPDSHDVVLHWFDALGGQREEFRGTWSGEALTVQSKNAMGFMRLSYDLSEPGKLKNSGEMSRDGEQWTRMFDGAHERQTDG